ncbi:serine/threonine protein kinase [Calothrix sp. PCC 6303]|uniref:serine/threonine protein kinase n=1 Tax=Calothrix sp. PCC 6303 TaxID=1170562 RepID=UPI0002A057D7|nr:serine/threonine-protein kinase [Calothrix sp. PCC 6303]AFZ02772.1 serine/threonine protein kinase [Calothrix sp. PCC 6303]
MNENTSKQILNERYEVVSELGRQTGRRTLLATDLQTQQQVVVKVLYLGQDFDWQDLKLFQRESETLKTLEHSQIPRYLDYFEFETSDDKGFGLVQTYVGAKSLEEQLQAGRRFSESEIKELAISLLEILNYLHQRQPAIIHRDIKPSNILLSNRSGNSVGEVYLVDFGSVQNIAAQEGGTITVVGTYGYMPPEQFGGRTKPASDLYSLGATLIYVMTGLHPTELPQQDLRIKFPQAGYISRKFADWLEWMTEPSLEQRFTSAQIALDAIENPPQRRQIIQELNPALSKPQGSSINLIKTSDRLEIILPPTGFGIGLIVLISCLTPFAIGITFLSQGLDSLNRALATNTLASGFFWLLQGSAIALILFLVLAAIFKRAHLQLNDGYLTVIHHLLGFKWSQKIIKMNQVIHVKMISDKYNTGVKENLFMYHGNRVVFNFDEYCNLNTLEREWLKNEIRDWLNKMRHSLNND